MDVEKRLYSVMSMLLDQEVWARLKRLILPTRVVHMRQVDNMGFNGVMCKKWGNVLTALPCVKSHCRI